MNQRPLFSAFGFPVIFRTSALIVGGLAILLLQQFGVILVCTLALSILVHELGHSFAFRRYGTESHIVVHLFGGYSSPDRPQVLSHRQWVITAAAGPLTALVLLGVPAVLFRQFYTFEADWPFQVASVMVWFNVYWGLANLLPIWPFDGGRILFHGSNGNWTITRAVTLVLSIPACIAAYMFGYSFAAIFVAFNAFQVMQSRGPNSGIMGDSQGSQGSRVGEAVAEAKRFAPQPVDTKGKAGLSALNDVYRELANDRYDRAADILEPLLASGYRHAAERAQAWSAMLNNEEVIPHVQAPTPLLRAALDRDVDEVAASLRAVEVDNECGPILVLLRRSDDLRAVCGKINVDDIGLRQLQELERLTLQLGLVHEQMQITTAMSTT